MRADIVKMQNMIILAFSWKLLAKIYENDENFTKIKDITWNKWIVSYLWISVVEP